MNRELQDFVWQNCLPKEFKEEVRTIYAATLRMVDKRESAEQIYINKLFTLEGIFGFDNLTSDTEGEEMLMVSRKKVQEVYSYNEEILSQDPTHGGAKLLKTKLQALFGSKCLPDEVGNEDNFATKEPKPNEPTPKPHNSGELESQAADNHGAYSADYHSSRSRHHFGENSDMVDHFRNPTKMFDGIIKDGFRDHNRLHIAAMVIAAIMGSDDWTAYRGGTDEDVWHNMAKASLGVADALLSEAEKGGTRNE